MLVLTEEPVSTFLCLYDGFEVEFEPLFTNQKTIIRINSSHFVNIRAKVANSKQYICIAQ